ncbi:defensin [Drosophila virilis]|uniref:Invertebrate defensins family profile domain-containing protein n=1 Tax=Drosophila virilis TaxID=7244 RepID=B4LMJ9_DROVI|nr:defensin [Drosophila virilis]EDW59986.1 uncharacterized protein Dvir_GJ21126 [Drosophila virilis]
MKLIVCLGLLLILAVTNALTSTHEATAPTGMEWHPRQKRATCDLLSFWNVKNTACVAHCLARRYKGGYCNNKAICVCRR